jgi:hypothetical protein
MKKFLPPQLLYLSIAVMIMLHFLFPVKQLLDFPVTLAGIALVIIGVFTAQREKSRFA